MNDEATPISTSMLSGCALISRLILILQLVNLLQSQGELTDIPYPHWTTLQDGTQTVSFLVLTFLCSGKLLQMTIFRNGDT